MTRYGPDGEFVPHPCLGVSPACFLQGAAPATGGSASLPTGKARNRSKSLRICALISRVTAPVNFWPSMRQQGLFRPRRSCHGVSAFSNFTKIRERNEFLESEVAFAVELLNDHRRRRTWRPVTRKHASRCSRALHTTSLNCCTSAGPGERAACSSGLRFQRRSPSRLEYVRDDAG